MHRNEAFALKSELASELFPPPELPIERVFPHGLRPGGRELGRGVGHRMPPLGRALRRATRGRVNRPSLAVGVTVDHDGDHRIAALIQARSAETEEKLRKIRGVTREVDEQVIGRVVKQAAVGSWQRDRQRPLRIGSSVGHASGTTGTLGCFVRQADGRVKMLSNNHVLAAENAARVGDAVLQPGDRDLGHMPDDVVGELASFVELTTLETNSVDCAVALLRDGLEADARSLAGGELDGIATDEEAIEVEKVGRTTGATRGRVTAIGLINVIVTYDIGDIRFDGVMQVESGHQQPFSDAGDSGALVYTADTHRAVGLLFAGTDLGGAFGTGRTFVHPIGAVLTALDAQLVR
jgi:hypothetical protein